MVAFVDLYAARAVIARVEHALQECALQRPGGFGLLTAIPTGHGIVEPAVRSARTNFDRVALVVMIETVAQAAHVVERDHVVGFPEDSENRTFHRGDDLLERLGITRANLPLARRGSSVPDDRRCDRSLRRQHQWMASGLADAGHRDS